MSFIVVASRKSAMTPSHPTLSLTLYLTCFSRQDPVLRPDTTTANEFITISASHRANKRTHGVFCRYILAKLSRILKIIAGCQRRMPNAAWMWIITASFNWALRVVMVIPERLRYVKIRPGNPSDMTDTTPHTTHRVQRKNHRHATQIFVYI